MNLEIDRASAYHRFHEIYEALGWPPTHITDIDVWNLRGHSRALSELVPAVKRAMETSGADVLILDPIYKVITGDENSASEMGAFCNQFDRICSATGAAAIYCHHHSKGAQGQKKTMDRASGSGVFARDPDALLDLIGLEMDEDTRNNVRDGDATPWRLEGTLREFRNFEPRNLWFKYPLHVLDQENLSHLPVEGSFEAVRIKSHKYSTKNSRKAALENAFEALSLDSPVTVKAIAQYLKLDEHTVRGHLHQFPESFEFWKGEVRRPEGYCEDSEEDEEDELSAS